MPIIRLTDVVATMKDKWTYGDKFFGYTDEFNDNHNTQYPSLLITPPNSIYPEVTPRNGWEEYAFEVYFSDLYNRTAQANESIEQRWDNLQDLGNEWLDMFLKSYSGVQSGKTTISYLTDGSLSIERNKEVANDQLLQIKMSFNWTVFSKCFNPVSNYPNQIEGLKIWLSADSNLTFNIPTKKVEAWGDRSGNNNNFSQNNKSIQPKRYTYSLSEDYLNGKTNISYTPSSSPQYLSSDDISLMPFSTGNFTVFIVAAYGTNVSSTQESILGLEPSGAGQGYIKLGQRMIGQYQAIVSDGTNVITAQKLLIDKEAIMTYKLDGDTMTIYSNNVAGTPVTEAGFNATGKFIGGDIAIGGYPSVATSGFAGSLGEVIVYNTALTDNKRQQVEDYLNKKYRIY